MDWGEAQETLGLHQKRGAHNEAYDCAYCRVPWPCPSVDAALAVMRDMSGDPVYGEVLGLNGKRHE